MVIISTHEKAWKYEKKVYAISNWKLPVPVNLSRMGYFGIGLFLMLIVSKIPLIAMIPAVIRYLLVPFLIMKFLARITFDGKSPLRWLAGFFGYARESRSVSRFKSAEPESDGVFSCALKARRKI